MAAKGWIEVNDLHCKGCSLCVSACPKDVLSPRYEPVNTQGLSPCLFLISRMVVQGAEYVRLYVLMPP